MEGVIVLFFCVTASEQYSDISFIASRLLDNSPSADWNNRTSGNLGSVLTLLVIGHKTRENRQEAGIFWPDTFYLNLKVSAWPLLSSISNIDDSGISTIRSIIVSY